MDQEHFRVSRVKHSQAVPSSEPCRAQWLNPMVTGGGSPLGSAQQGQEVLQPPPLDAREGKEGQVSC